MDPQWVHLSFFCNFTYVVEKTRNRPFWGRTKKLLTGEGATFDGWALPRCPFSSVAERRLFGQWFDVRWPDLLVAEDGPVAFEHVRGNRKQHPEGGDSGLLEGMEALGPFGGSGSTQLARAQESSEEPINRPTRKRYGACW